MKRLWAVGLLVAFVACAPEDDEVEPATAQPLTEATYAGRTEDADLFAAVVTAPDGVEAYLCDGAVGFWFRGAGSADSVMAFENEGGASLLLQLDDGRMHGRLIASDASETAFEIPEVDDEVLFRADDMLGDTPVVGGWIRLPDGEQRGVVIVGSTSQGSTLDTSGVQCTLCSVVSSLSPAPFTPSAALRRPNVLQRVTIVGLGDSYMSGEGAPVVDGRFNSDGTSGTEEQWSDGQPQFAGTSFSISLTEEQRARLEREALACHRGSAGLGLAVADLQRKFPFAALLHQTFACSGAQVRHAIDTPYGGPGGCASLSGAEQTSCLDVSDDMPTPTIRPQLQETLDFVRSQRLNLDAVVMSIGGNDLGFGYIIADCLGSPGGGCEADDSEAQDVLSEGTEFLPAEYDRLGAALASAGVPDANVYLALYPSPLRRTATDNCSGLEFDDALLRFLSDEEARFAGEVHTQMNAMVRDGAARNGWKLVSSHVGTEVGHSMCNGTAAWFNDTQSALRTQGADLPPQALGLVRVSAGMVHPNRAGHREAYKPAYEASLDAMLRKRFTPRTPTNVRVTRMALVSGRGSITVTWDDVNLFEARTNVLGADGRVVASASADRTSVDYLLDGTTGSVSVEACVDTPKICSSRSTAFDVAVKRPDVAPKSPTATLTLGTVPRQIRLAWADKVPSRMFSTVEVDIGGTISRRAVEAQQLLFPETTDVRRFRVATCNDLGCGPATSWVDFRRPVDDILPICNDPVLNGCRG